MATAALAWELTRLRQMVGGRPATDNPALETIRADATAVMSLAGMEPDHWQRRLLTSDSGRSLVLCSRQSGKSTTAAALALRTALVQPAALVLLLSPTLRQSSELFRKVMENFTALGRPVGVTVETVMRLELANGSRVISLPGTEGTIRGYSGAALLVIDEAARVDDDLYRSVRPMLAVSQGRLVVLSTPFGKRGWFYEAWRNPAGWDTIEVTAEGCPRILPEFLREEREALGERWYRQEYFCSFEDTVGAVFGQADIDAVFRADWAEPLTLE